MPRDRIELSTPGFSDRCSTTELPRHYLNIIQNFKTFGNKNPVFRRQTTPPRRFWRRKNYKMLRRTNSAASDMPRKLMHVRHHQGFFAQGRRTAYAFAQPNAYARGFALKGAQYQFASFEYIKPRPVEAGQPVIQGRRQVGHIGHRVGFLFQEGAYLRREFPV